MKNEFEATFLMVDKKELIKKLKDNNFYQYQPQTLVKTVLFSHPLDANKFGRARVHGNKKITIAIKKNSNPENIYGLQEVELEINDLKNGIDFLLSSGFKQTSSCESKIELWRDKQNNEVSIEDWPYLETFIEIEANDEDAVKKISQKLGFDYANAKFSGLDTYYAKKYNKQISKIRKINLVFNKNCKKELESV